MLWRGCEHPRGPHGFKGKFHDCGADRRNTGAKSSSQEFQNPTLFADVNLSAALPYFSQDLTQAVTSEWPTIRPESANAPRTNTPQIARSRVLADLGRPGPEVEGGEATAGESQLRRRIIQIARF